MAERGIAINGFSGIDIGCFKALIKHSPVGAGQSDPGTGGATLVGPVRLPQSRVGRLGIERATFC